MKTETVIPPEEWEIPDIATVERRVERLGTRAEERHREFRDIRQEQAETEAFLELAPRTEALMEELGTELFGELLDDIEASLTQGIREILGQNRTVISERDIKNSRLNITFRIENEGNVEDILHGQGGSVCNILSTGLRLIALAQLDPRKHRPFLVLDEQDCWLKPQLVPRYMSVIKDVAERLGLQVLVISHHPLDLFATKAEKIYFLKPDRKNGVTVDLRDEGEDV